MSDMIIIRPATPGAVVRDPVSFRQVRDEGEKKPRNVYWQRRLDAGDVVIVPEAATTQTSKSGTSSPRAGKTGERPAHKE
jgi:hypothetical protein